MVQILLSRSLSSKSTEKGCIQTTKEKECDYATKEVKTKLSGALGLWLQMSSWPISCESGPPSEGLEKAKVEGP